MPPKPISRTFPAVLTRTGNSLNWVVIHLPFDAQKIWGTRGQIRVKGEINKFAFRTTLFPTGTGLAYRTMAAVPGRAKPDPRPFGGLCSATGSGG